MSHFFATSCIVGTLTLGALVAPNAAGAQPAPGKRVDWLYSLEDVSAGAPDDVWAVGSRYHDAISKTFIQHWDGSAWSTVPSPNRSPRCDDELNGVVALTPSNVWAVGSYRPQREAYVRRTLIEHWDGARWTIVPSPSGHYWTALEAVDAVSPDDVWAVGRIQNTTHPGSGRAVFEHWDGTSWSMIDSPVPRRQVGGLSAVGVVSADDVWALAPRGAYHRDASGWQLYTRQHRSGGDGLSMDSSGDGWSVGGQVIRHWNGLRWQQVSSPLAYIEDVSALSPTDAWMVTAGNDYGHWDGDSWTHVDSPPGNSANFRGVHMISSDDVWAVGADGFQNAVVDHWNGIFWTRIE